MIEEFIAVEELTREHEVLKPTGIWSRFERLESPYFEAPSLRRLVLYSGWINVESKIGYKVKARLNPVPRKIHISTTEPRLIEKIAAIIRNVDGNRSLGAAELAEAIVSELAE